MATDVLRALSSEGKHNVGVINSIDYNTIPHGAVALEDMDNWILAEKAGFNEYGDLQCKPLEDPKAAAYLVATVAQRPLGEDLGHFFNAEGEKVVLVHLRAGYTRFEVSNFEVDGDLEEPKEGNVAHYDTEEKVFVISDAESPHADYEEAGTKFEVVGGLAATAGRFAVPVVRLMVTETAYDNQSE